MPKAKDTDRFIVCVIGDAGDSYWRINGTQYNEVLKASNHQNRIDAIVAGDEARISDTSDIDVTFDNCDEEQWRDCFKEDVD